MDESELKLEKFAIKAGITSDQWSAGRIAIPDIQLVKNAETQVKKFGHFMACDLSPNKNGSHDFFILCRAWEPPMDILDGSSFRIVFHKDYKVGATTLTTEELSNCLTVEQIGMAELMGCFQRACKWAIQRNPKAFLSDDGWN